MESNKHLHENEQTTESKTTISRRQALKALGIGGIMVACGSLLNSGTALAQAADNQSNNKESKLSNLTTVRSVPNVASLKVIPAKDLYDGMVVSVMGYQLPSDGGQKNMIYLANSTEKDNGGTVHKPNAPAAKGAWHVVHNGIGDFRWFGIFDESQPADQALDALVNDLSFRKIEAHSNLLLIKRHIYHRSNLDLDFNNNTVFTYGAENANRDNPFAATIFFQGIPDGSPFEVTLPNAKDKSGHPVQYCQDSDYLYTSNNNKFKVNEWYFVQTNVRPRVEVEDRHPIGGGASDREIQKLLMVTKIGLSGSDTNYVGFNYMNAWPLEGGRKLIYQRIKPVFNVNVYNMKFEGQGHSDISGTSPVAHEFCVDCNVINLHATKVFWPLNIRRYCTTYEIKNCSLTNAQEVKMGGSGYMLQQIGCLYAHVSDCRAHNIRHLNDFTGCAYSMVENCHCTGDENGAFVTHGQYDHDLTFIGNSGFLSFANSALDNKSPHMWGGWHKRITVKKHSAPRIVFENKMNRVMDMTIEDCYVYRDIDRYGGNAGSIWANVDGLVMRNCVSMGSLNLGQDSNLSPRPSLIENCSFHMTDGDYLTRHRGSKFEVTRDITFKNCNFYNVGQNFIVMCKNVSFYDCHFYANPDAKTSRLNVEAEHIRIIGGGLHNVCFAFDKGETTETAVGNQTLTIDGGAVFEGSNKSGALIDIKNSAHISFDIGKATFRPDANIDSIKNSVEGGTLALRADGTTFVNTKLQIPSSSMGPKSYVIVNSCILDKSTLSLPSSQHVVTANNLTL